MKLTNYTASVKKYDPDDEWGEDFPTIREAISWIYHQARYGFYTGHVSDGVTTKRHIDITAQEVEQNHFDRPSQ